MHRAATCAAPLPLSPPADEAADAAAAQGGAALAHIELGMVSAMHAFQRWMVCCMAVSGLDDLTAVDVLVLHHVNHRAQEKRLADICFILHIEDTHVVAYSLRKLIGLGVIHAERQGKEVKYSTTQQGRTYLSHYGEIRERRLIDALETLGLNPSALGELAHYLRKLSGRYDQAARAAASL